MPRAAGSSYRLRNQGKIASELKVSVEGSRAQLVDRALAMRTAKARTTRALREGPKGMPDYAGGSSLKEGLQGMAERSEVGSEMFKRVSDMDQNVLAEMYHDNKLTFEVVFNYEGIRYTGKDSGADPYEVIDPQKKLDDFDFLVGEYNRYAAATGRRTV